MNKTTEVFEFSDSNYSSTSVERALNLAEEALYAELESDTCEEFAEAAEKCHKALAAIREALAEQDKQEPVAVVDEIGKRLDGTYIFNAVGKVDVGQPLYAAPVDSKAIRAEALEDRNQVLQNEIAMLKDMLETCRAETLEEAEEIAKTIGGSFSVEFLAAIRGLE